MRSPATLALGVSALGVWIRRRARAAGPLVAALLVVAAAVVVPRSSPGQGLLPGPGASSPSDDDSLPAEITADQVEYDRARSLYTAEGNVRLSQGRRTLTADWVTFNNVTRQGVASGDVVVVDGPDTLRADFMEFNVDTLEGFVFQGRLDGRTTPFRLAAREIERTGNETYTLDDPEFTACRCPDPEDREPWKIKATTAELGEDGYGRARNSTFEVLGVPILWFPYIRYPVKVERKTGFLFPTFGSSNQNGFELGIPFFWAARENLDIFLTPNWLQERGFKPHFDLEWLFGRENVSRLHLAYIHDEKIDPTAPSTPFSRDRWAVRGYHDQHLPHGVRVQANVNLVSDNSYAFDFDGMGGFRSGRGGGSEGVVSEAFGPSGRFGVFGGVVVRDDLQNPDDLDRDGVLLQRLPSLFFHVQPAPIIPETDLLASFHGEYTYFNAWEDAFNEISPNRIVSNVFADTGNDGVDDPREKNAQGVQVGADPAQDDFPLGFENDFAFQAGEILPNRGQRLLLHPRLGHPLRLFDFLELLPEVGYRQAFYQTDRLGVVNRGYVTGRVDVRTRLRRELELPFGVGRATHLLEPRVGWALVAKSAVSKSPIFVPQPAFRQQRLRELDLDNLVLDPADRLAARSSLVAGFGNRVYGRGLAGAVPRLLADVTVLAEYDFFEGRAGEVVLDGTLYPGGGISARMILGYGVSTARFEEAFLQAGWSSPDGDDIGVSYRFLDPIPEFFERFPFDGQRFRDPDSAFQAVNQLGVYARWAITRNWALTYNGTYSAEGSTFLLNQGGIEYLSRCRCWAIRVEANEDPVRGARFGVRYRVVGLGDDTVRPFAAGGSGSGLLPDTGAGVF